MKNVLLTSSRLVSRRILCAPVAAYNDRRFSRDSDRPSDRSGGPRKYPGGPSRSRDAYEDGYERKERFDDRRERFDDRRERYEGSGGRGRGSTGPRRGPDSRDFDRKFDRRPSDRAEREPAPYREPATPAAARKPLPRVMDTQVPVAPGKDVYPTFVPRQEGIKDGSWTPRDAQLVEEALQDASTRAQVATTSTAPAAAASTRAKVPPPNVLLEMSMEQLQELTERHGQPKYRAKQLYDALMKGHRAISEFSTIPKEWRAKLEEEGYKTGRSTIFHSVAAKDGTKKYLLQVSDGRVLETVGIPAQDGRLTVCVSSQVGCPMRCNFCATGKGGFARNLYAHEIVDQVMTIQEEFGTRVSNVVFMGMGEPLLNLPNVLRAHEVLNKGLGIGARHITISTVGVPNAIAKFAEQKLQSRLAVSLHAPNQKLREDLIPSAKVYPIEALLQDCHAFFKTTGRRVSFEYTLLSKVNDRPEHAEELAALLKRFGMTDTRVGKMLPGRSMTQQQRMRGVERADETDRVDEEERFGGYHVNLIPYNPVDEGEYERPSRESVEKFAELLRRQGVNVTIRVTRGLEAAAACGQLRNQFQKQPAPLMETKAGAVATPAL